MNPLPEWTGKLLESTNDLNKLKEYRDGGLCVLSIICPEIREGLQGFITTCAFPGLNVSSNIKKIQFQNKYEMEFSEVARVLDFNPLKTTDWALI